ncbi:MAG: DUF2723 domain-containing protein [Acidobacteria bacterium]|nr:DUF2723 domain-containing protein [Acidobacteriota bacterium]
MANRIAVAAVVATVAFWAYTRTLVPGVDLGDTGGFQAAVLWPEVSARQAYPLYYALARPFVAAASPGNPARALNLFSAIGAAAAVGLLTWLCASIARSLAGGVAAGLLLAFSYTFWTQAVIAEVYALHLTLIAACLVSLHAYATGPSTRRLAVFFAVYALSFGNHLGMILLFVPFTVFLLQTGRPRELVRPPVVLLAVALAAAGALQYWPNVMAVGGSIEAPDGWMNRLAAFWFDVTKQDWRDSMVLGLGPDQASDRLGMWWFDLRQQFGIAGIALAAAGAAALWRLSRPWAVLAATAYAMSTIFALTYNVGDVHVFFLPGHFFTALCAGCAVGLVARRAPLYGAPGARRGVKPRPTVVAAAVVVSAAFLYAGWRGWSTWPAVDRHDDRRGERLIARLTLGLDEQNAVLVSQMNWQLENVLLYAGRFQRPQVAWVRLDDVLPHFPFLVEDNHAAGRDLVATAEAAAQIAAAYGPRFALVEDAGLPAPGLSELVAQLPDGVPYVLCLLTPPRDESLDPDVMADVLAALTGGRTPARTEAAYELIAGISGERPLVYRASSRPFHVRFRILDEPFTVRMDSWLPTDTFRRPGFGHVIRGREHVLVLERGVNMVWLGRDGRPSPPFYAASLFAPKPRYRLSAATPQLARAGRQ